MLSLHIKLSEECWALDKCYLIFILISIFTLLKNYVYDTTSVRKQTGADGKVLLGNAGACCLVLLTLKVSCKVRES